MDVDRVPARGQTGASMSRATLRTRRPGGGRLARGAYRAHGHRAALAVKPATGGPTRDRRPRRSCDRARPAAGADPPSIAAAGRRCGSRSPGGSRTGCPCRAPDSGLMMNICAVAGLRSAASFGMLAARRRRSWRAPRRATIGSPQISAPTRSASYSRVRLIAICTSMAASGARMTAISTPTSRAGCRCRGRRRRRSAKLREHRDGAGDGRGDGHGQRVAVLDVRQLVRHDAGDLLAASAICSRPVVARDGGVLGIAAGGEGVRAAGCR